MTPKDIKRRGCCFLAVMVFLLVVLSRSAFAEDSVPIYGMWETKVGNAKPYANTFDFRVVELQATFTAPSGKDYRFYGFYDGDGFGADAGNIWKIRFPPNEVGTWRYRYAWTDGTPGGDGRFDVVDTGLRGRL
jgi:hypothetical protein